jgi:hypothetical protein
MQPVSGVRPLAGATAHVEVTGCDVAIAVHWVDGAELSVPISDRIVSAVQRARQFTALLNSTAVVLPVTYGYMPTRPARAA